MTVRQRFLTRSRPNDLVSRFTQLRLQPGDIVSVECSRALTVQEVHKIRSLLASIVPSSVQVVVVGSNVRLRQGPPVWPGLPRID